MAITIKKVSTKKELKQFIRFNYKLYNINNLGNYFYKCNYFFYLGNYCYKCNYFCN